MENLMEDGGLVNKSTRFYGTKNCWNKASITALVAKIDNTVDITDCFSSLWKICLQQTADVIRNEKWMRSYSALIFGKVI